MRIRWDFFQLRIVEVDMVLSRLVYDGKGDLLPAESGWSGCAGRYCNRTLGGIVNIQPSSFFVLPNGGHSLRQVTVT